MSKHTDLTTNELIALLDRLEAQVKAKVEPTAKARKTPKAPKAKVDPKAAAEALVEEKGLAFTSGRVYLNDAAIKAAAQVSKTGTPKVVKTSDSGRTSHVLVWRTEHDGGYSVAIQNLRTP